MEGSTLLAWRGPKSCRAWHNGSPSEVSLLLCRADAVVKRRLTIWVTWNGGDSDMEKHCATVDRLLVLCISHVGPEADLGIPAQEYCDTTYGSVSSTPLRLMGKLIEKEMS